MAYKYLYEHTSVPDKKIIAILEGLIAHDGGIDVIINRNQELGCAYPEMV